MKKLIILISLIGINAKAQGLDAEVKKYIHKAAIKYNVPEWELLKIAYVESTLRKNPPARYNKNKTYDVGMFQINSIHWHGTCNGLKIETLEGNTYCAAKLLAQHKSKASTDVDWVARYHSKTPKHKKKYAQKLAEAELYLVDRKIASEWYIAKD